MPAFSEKPRPGASIAPLANGTTAIIPKVAPRIFLPVIHVITGTPALMVWLPSPEEAGFERYGRLSDHLPLSVTLAPVRSIDR